MRMAIPVTEVIYTSVKAGLSRKSEGTIKTLAPACHAAVARGIGNALAAALLLDQPMHLRKWMGVLGGRADAGLVRRADSAKLTFRQRSQL